ncbi:helix-turn-helix transcriptional regulator [Macrococcus bovicus]|uniref:XRE family transcriptional regulator n=1 Tax=Macrococcus bovicus TaxID=69968 RepID=A0A4R6BWW6_9STAP|nr:helix-turn-helix transcriptional regulator [Macrococcus bovicus]TDM12694.1 XRE family transcriptional regulator [Macrococcus bovicus]
MQMYLWRLRKERKLSQNQFAKILGMSRNTYSAKERGEIPFNSDEMFKASEYLELPIDQIFLPICHQNGDINNRVEV